jgi:3-oxoacyl-[acyl-carrier-protein] synthase II
MRKAVITGIGVVSPLGSDVNTFWSRLTSGHSGIRRITKFDTTAYASQIAGEVVEFDVDKFVDRKEQRRMDEFSHFALGAAKLAIEDSGLNTSQMNPERIGVVVGSGIGGLQTLQVQYKILLEKGPSRCSPFMIPQMISNIASGLIAIQHNLQGPNYSVISACATGAHSIGDAVRLIERGDADAIVAGGTEASVCELGVGGFCALRALCQDHNDDPAHSSRPFDKNRSGFVISEGAGIVVVEELEHARRRGATIYCEVGGFGMSCDAYHMTAPADDGNGAARAMALAIKDAGLRPEDVDYINAHGTSTELNDKIETRAIKTALGDHARKVMISSSKSMTGHMLGAAGGIETIVCALAIRDGIVPPTMNQDTPDPDCDLDYVPNTARQANVRVCLNNSLGFGGHNACLLLKKLD